MKKVAKLFVNIKTEQEWLARQTGWKLVHINGIFYTFEESSCEYKYEYVYFDKSKKELDDIKNQIIDNDIEFVCNSSSWALYRKDAAKGEIHVYADNYIKYKVIMKKYNTYMALSACYLCLGSSQIVLASTVTGYFRFIALLFYFSSFMFFITSFYFKKYSLEYDDGSYADRMKKEKDR